MKKYLVIISLLLASAYIFTGCLDSKTDSYEEYLKRLEEQRILILEQYSSDSLLIVNYLAEMDSTAIFDEESGIFYNIVEPGSEPYPKLSAGVGVKYYGMLLDGTVFNTTEEDEVAWFIMNQLISGWQIGLAKIGTGGRIILYLPSYFGYGSAKYHDIPTNSVLIFDVELVTVL